MTSRPASLPDFASPPINEVVLGLQSDRLAITAPYLGLFWERIRGEYPTVEIQPALDPVVERFGDKEPVGVIGGFRLMDKPETPRCWFIDGSGNRLVQIQEDRLLHNWRGRENDAYPRYPEVRAGFEKAAAQLEAFVAEYRLGDIGPSQCEVTYLNHIPKGSGWNAFGELHEVFTVIAPSAGEFLPPLERGLFSFSYVIPGRDGSPMGRLTASLKLAIRKKDAVPILLLDLTARGKPERPGVRGALAFMDVAHEWIVRAFAELTTPRMHQLWGRMNG